MIKLFEVSVSLESGYTMAVLMASPDAATAVSEVAKQLHDVAEPRNVGDVMRYRFDTSEMTAKEVNVSDA